MDNTGWTVQDKLTMYRGLVTIFRREQENQLRDTKALRKQNKANIRKLEAEIKELKEKLLEINTQVETTALLALQGHKELQIGARNIDDKSILAFLSKKLKKLKESLSVCNVDLKNTEAELLRTELEAKKISNSSEEDLPSIDAVQEKLRKIQEYKAKFNTAKNGRNIYEKINYILKSDQAGFRIILDKLKTDQELQQKCLIRAMEMGQLATEDNANMEKNFKSLLKEVQKYSHYQRMDLNELKHLVNDTEKQTQAMFCSGSVADLSADGSDDENVGLPKLEESVERAENQLQLMQQALLVPSFNDIEPRLAEQLRQNDRLVAELNYQFEKYEYYTVLRSTLDSKYILAKTRSSDESLFVLRRGVHLENIALLKDAIQRARKEVRQTVLHLCTLRGAFRRFFLIIATVPSFQDQITAKCDASIKQLPISKQVLAILDILRAFTLEENINIGCSGVLHEEQLLSQRTFIKKLRRATDVDKEHSRGSKQVLKMVEKLKTQGNANWKKNDDTSSNSSFRRIMKLMATEKERQEEKFTADHDSVSNTSSKYWRKRIFAESKRIVEQGQAMKEV